MMQRPTCLATCATALLLLSFGAAQAREARCSITEGRRVTYSGPCDFSADGRGGSFSLASRRPQGSLLKEISVLSVSMIAPGVADVRGLTSAGINSRWGEARRSQRDPACWVGSDFQVCVW